MLLSRREGQVRLRGARREREAGQGRAGVGAMPPSVLVLLSICSVQVGAALAKGLFAELGPAGTVFLRVGSAALVLLVVWRPRLRGHSRREYGMMLLFGLTLATMNLVFYSSLARIPLGVAVTVEFVGPLGVAVAGSRRLLDLVWVVLAGAGILLLAPLGQFGGPKLDPLGLGLALVAGGFWALYILVSARVGRVFQDGTGLALAMGIGALALVPAGVIGGGAALLNPPLLLAGAGVGVLSSVIPYSLELEALRRLPTRVFGILMSLEPAIAALAGLLILHEAFKLREGLALALVTAASVGASRLKSGK
jgi:inner membrane transporter RhtA